MPLTCKVEVFSLLPSDEQSSAASSREVQQMEASHTLVLGQGNCKVHLSSAGCQKKKNFVTPL